MEDIPEGKVVSPFCLYFGESDGRFVEDQIRREFCGMRSLLLDTLLSWAVRADFLLAVFGPSLRHRVFNIIELP